MDCSPLLQLSNPNVTARMRPALTPTTKSLQGFGNVMWCPLIARSIRQRDEPRNVWTVARTINAMQLGSLPN